MKKTDELPWQYKKTGSWKRLHDLLADLSFFAACWEADKQEVHAYWTQVEGNSSLRLVEAYQHVINDPAQYSEHVWSIALFLDNMGHLDEALFLQEYLVDHFRQSSNMEDLQAALGNQALILDEGGDMDGAMGLHKEEERICSELGDREGLCYSLVNQALILGIKQNQTREALSLADEVYRLAADQGFVSLAKQIEGIRSKIARKEGK